MNRLIVICKEECHANHLAFLLGISNTLVLPFFNSECINLINPEAVGGFVTITEPYSDKVIELRECLRTHPIIGYKLINLDFDKSGQCRELMSIVHEIRALCSYYESSYYMDKELKLKSFKHRFRDLFDIFGMTLEKGFDFDIYESQQQKIILKGKTNPFNLFLNLLRKYNEL